MMIDVGLACKNRSSDSLLSSRILVIDKLVKSRRNINSMIWCKYGAVRGPKCSRWVAPERIEGMDSFSESQ
jgi:hypothetical protein